MPTPRPGPSVLPGRECVRAGELLVQRLALTAPLTRDQQVRQHDLVGFGLVGFDDRQLQLQPLEHGSPRDRGRVFVWPRRLQHALALEDGLHSPMRMGSKNSRSPATVARLNDIPTTALVFGSNSCEILRAPMPSSSRWISAWARSGLYSVV